jgi:hypothetical protein
LSIYNKSQKSSKLSERVNIFGDHRLPCFWA